MQHPTRRISLSLFILLLSQLSHATNMAVTTKIGFTGAGVDLTTQWHPNFNARIGLQAITHSTDSERSGIEYEIDAKFNTLGILVDWHPGGGGFFLSGGLMRNNTNLAFSANNTDNESLEIGDTSYTGTFSIDGELAARQVAPYLGLGWGNPIKQNGGFGFLFELGFIFQGSPELSLTASGLATEENSDSNANFDVTTNVEFQENLTEEKENFLDETDLDDLKILPVLNFGVSYHF